MRPVSLVVQASESTTALPMTVTGAVVLLLGLIITAAWVVYLYR